MNVTCQPTWLFSSLVQCSHRDLSSSSLSSVPDLSISILNLIGCCLLLFPNLESLTHHTSSLTHHISGCDSLQNIAFMVTVGRVHLSVDLNMQRELDARYNKICFAVNYCLTDPLSVPIFQICVTNRQ